MKTIKCDRCGELMPYENELPKFYTGEFIDLCEDCEDKYWEVRDKILNSRQELLDNAEALAEIKAKQIMSEFLEED